jgi:hypothetical protein
VLTIGDSTQLWEIVNAFVLLVLLNPETGSDFRLYGASEGKFFKTEIEQFIVQ